MIKYKVINENSIVEFINEEDANIYAENNGGTVSSFEEAESVPGEISDVSPRQIRQALILNGISMQSITDALNTLPEPTKSLAIAEWEYSISFQRDRALVNSVGQMLGWSSTQLDNLWRFAKTL